jgi:hypothetical protein
MIIIGPEHLGQAQLFLEADSDGEAAFRRKSFADQPAAECDCFRATAIGGKSVMPDTR